MKSYLNDKKLSLKTAYYRAFVLFITAPLLLVLILSLLLLNQQFKKQAIENIMRAQDNIVTELTSDIDTMSMRLSHLIYTNNNEIMGYAAGTDTDNVNLKYQYEQSLAQAGNLALEPVKNIISVGFYMKSGKETYFKNQILYPSEETKTSAWYQTALENPNTVCVGAYNIKEANDLYKGSQKDMLVLVFALSPDVSTDRSQKIEMVTFYQITGTGSSIKEYNQNYLKGQNKLGIMQIADDKGEVIFSTFQGAFPESYTCVKTPVLINNNTWYVESYIKTSELTADFWRVAWLILIGAFLVFVMAGYYSRYFLRSIVVPVEDISAGLKQVEEGNLDIHITPQGQHEIRNMIHQFNAMARRLQILIGQYEERIRNKEKNPAYYFSTLIKKELTPSEVEQSFPEFFADHYLLMGFYAENSLSGQSVSVQIDPDNAQKLAASFEHNPRFASRCLIYMESSAFFFFFYRISEDNYLPRILQMVNDLQAAASRDLHTDLSVCIGKVCSGSQDFEAALQKVTQGMPMRFLYGEHAIVNLSIVEDDADSILTEVPRFKRLADAMYVADEKNLIVEKEILFEDLERIPRDKGEILICAAILAIAMRFESDNMSFTEIFEKKYNYPEKLKRLEDLRSLKLWLTNYFTWIMDYSASRLQLFETDVVVKAKRYIAANYMDAELSLIKVAQYVELNEKYFTNRFSKETGETFSSYLTAFRIQKAKELLKTTTFKVYEISHMVGYHSVEHFNRVFKRLCGMTPAQYRKAM